MRVFSLAGMIAAAIVLCTIASPAASGPIEDSFYPYRNGFPSYPGLEPGMIVDKSNVEQFREILDPQIFKEVKAGYYQMRIGSPMSFELHPNYIEASRQNSKVRINAEGTLDNHVAGRPFPELLSVDDPQAGVKAAWNYLYGFNAGDSEIISPFWWSFRDFETGKLERLIKFEGHFLKFAQRVVLEPKPEAIPNTAGIYRSLWLVAREPFDVANTQLLIHRYKDDLKRDDAWLYLGFQRRVRRLATGQVTDSFLGTDLMIEDFEGYNGRITDYNWKLAKTTTLLMPFYDHSKQPLEPEAPGTPDGFKFPTFTGQGNCYPNVDWTLRKAYLVYGTPKDPSHPIGRRELYFDAQTFVIGRQIILDRKNDVWKHQTICKAHPESHHPVNKGSGVPVEDCAVTLDVQAGHCTTLQFRSRIIETPESYYTVQNLRKSGR